MSSIILKPKNRERLLQVARDFYADPSDDDIEVDDNAEIHRSGSRGFWVQAWVHLRVEDVK